MSYDYSWCPYAKPKDQKKATGDKKATVETEVSEKSGQLKPKKPLQAKTKLKAKTPLKKSDKPINKKSKNKEEVTPATYNAVFERDKGQCRLKDKCCKGKLDLHHINGRGKGRTNNVDNCIILCDHHHNGIVHKENKKYRTILNNLIEKRLKSEM